MIKKIHRKLLALLIRIREMNLRLFRNKLKKYIRGNGIEIGTLHKPLDLSGTKISKIAYVDRMGNDELRKQYPELNDLPLVEVEVIADGSQLTQIPDESLDFIIANNLIEHLQNPIGALQNWYRKLRPSGIIYMAVPDKRYTFDIDRTITTIDHLIEDFQAKDEELVKRNYYHFVETAEVIEKRTGKDAEARIEDLIARNYSIHFHCWDFRSFNAFLQFLISKGFVEYSIVDAMKSTPWSKEFVFILGKQVQYKKNFLGMRVPILTGRTER